MRVDPKTIDPARLTHIVRIATEKALKARDLNHRLNELIGRNTALGRRISDMKADIAASAKPSVAARREAEELAPLLKAQVDVAREVAEYRVLSQSAHAEFQAAGILRDRVVKSAAAAGVTVKIHNLSGWDENPLVATSFGGARQ
jgi:hypothetical protein